GGCQDEPVLGTLADVHLPRAKGEKPAKLGCLIAMDRLDVKMQPVLGAFRSVWHGPEVDLERAAVGPDAHTVATAVDDLPAQCAGPELRELLGVCGIDDEGNDLVFHVHVVAHREWIMPARDARFCRTAECCSAAGSALLSMTQGSRES